MLLREITLNRLLPFRTQLSHHRLCIHIRAGHGNEPLRALDDFLCRLALDRLRFQRQRDALEDVLCVGDDGRVLSAMSC